MDAIDLVSRIMERYLAGVEKPGRYLANEINAFRKSFEKARVRFALAFPDVYEVGMSHLGLKLLYEFLNRSEGVMADRVYAPWIDLERNLRAAGEPLRALECNRALSDFDFVGFSLQYELSYTNILTMLDLGGIPLLAEARTVQDPWVIGGGPCVFNPEPLAEYFDFFVLGEAEEVLVELIAVFREWQSRKGKRQAFLEEIRTIAGVYVPAFFTVSYRSDGTVAATRPRYADHAQITRRLVPDLDKGSPIPEKPLVPMLEIVHNRLGLEIARGCTRGCRFCQAGFIYRPVRERDPQVVLERAAAALRNSGFEELSLLSLSTGDYCQVQALLAALMDRFLPDRIAVSLPSMRVGTLTPELMALVRQVRKTGFTLAPEAGSERLRQVINKNIRDEDLAATAEHAFRLGWRLLKLYFMIGLPGETSADRDALVRLGLEVWKLAKPSRSSVNVSISTFVPKPQTPFQWSAQLPEETVRECLDELKSRLRRPGLRMKWHDPGHSHLEAVFARGDRRLGRVLRRGWELGARFDGWSELFRADLWRQAFAETGLSPDFYATRERPLEELLPWDHLSPGVTKDFLKDEFRRALRGEFTEDCRFGQCRQCGVCDYENVRPQLYPRLDHPLRVEAQALPTGEEVCHLYWFRYRKTGPGRFFGQLEVAQSFSRAVRRAGLPAVYTRGFHPHIKLSFVEALPLGLESLVEEGYLNLSRKLEAEEVQLPLNAQLPPGLEIDALIRVERPFPRASQRRVTYAVTGLSSWQVRRIVPSWPKRAMAMLHKKTKKGEARAPLGEILLDVRQVDESSLELDVCEGLEMSFRPMAILQVLLEDPPEALPDCRICKIAAVPFTGREEEGYVLRANH